MVDLPSLNVVVFCEDFSCVVVVVSTVFTVSFFVVLVVFCVVLSFVLGGEDSSAALVDFSVVVDSFVVVLGVEGCVVVDSDVDFCVVVVDI